MKEREFAAHRLAPRVRAYDAAPLDLRIMPSEDARVRAAAVECIVTSTLIRARESVAVLVPGRSVFCDPVYDEVVLPTMIDLVFALEPRAWDFLSRAAWFCGRSGGCEPFTAARRWCCAGIMMSDFGMLP